MKLLIDCYASILIFKLFLLMMASVTVTATATATTTASTSAMIMKRTTHIGSSTDDAQIVKFDNDNIGSNGYNFYFETSDGVSRKESAKLKNEGTEDEAISVQGWVTWKGPDGVQYTLNYLADENGFQPEGAHLPVPPEV